MTQKNECEIWKWNIGFCIIGQNHTALIDDVDIKIHIYTQYKFNWRYLMTGLYMLRQSL